VLVWQAPLNAAACLVSLIEKQPANRRPNKNYKCHREPLNGINFGKIKEIVAPPNMIELQTNSYTEFLQAAATPKKRQANAGLESGLPGGVSHRELRWQMQLDYDSYEVGPPKVDWLECLREGLTYGAPLHVTFLLKEEGKSAKEEKVFMGELPLMTPQGTFVINGAGTRCRFATAPLAGHRVRGHAASERKIAPQFPGHSDRGSWYEAMFDTSDLLYVYLDRRNAAGNS